MQAAQVAKAELREEKWRFFRKRLKNSGISYLLMGPFLILFIIFTVLPVLAAIVLSFTNFDMLQFPRFVGLLNYERMLLDDEVFIKVLKNTLVFAIITGPLSYLLSFFFAWLISELKRWMRTLMTFIYYAPVLAGNVFFIWTFIFGGDRYSPANAFLLSMGFVKEPIQWLSNTLTVMPVLVIIQLWASLGAGVLSFIAGFQSLDRTLSEAGAIDGIKNSWQELWYIIMPQMAPQLMFSAVMQIAATFGVSTIIMTVAGFPTTEYCADTLGTYINDIGTVRYEMGYASAIAVFLFAMMLLINFVIKNALKHYSTD